jgi:uncharacterized protein
MTPPYKEEAIMIDLSKEEARRFMLMKHGLIGEKKFTGREGILQFMEQAGCIQFDPLDVCGRNSDLVLQSRVDGYTPELIFDLLYKERFLVDYFDKQLSIMHIRDWPYFARIRKGHHERGRSLEEIEAIIPAITQLIRDKGPVSSKDIGFDEKVHWYWSSTKLARAALETMYFRGDLVVHHKKGAIKYYALAEDHLPAETLKRADPLPDELDHIKWRMLRRIRSVGMLWDRASDAWLGITTMNAPLRRQAFVDLADEGAISGLRVRGLKDSLYIATDDLPLLKLACLNDPQPHRTEFLAPLDNMLWDRKLIRALFDFDYTWEVYVPPAKRKYGYYVLPILHGEGFAGRIDVVCDRKRGALLVNRIWYEEAVDATAELECEVAACLDRFRIFHGLEAVVEQN